MQATLTFSLARSRTKSRTGKIVRDHGPVRARFVVPPYDLVVPPYDLVVPPYNLVVPHHLISSRFVGAISPQLRPGPTSAYFCLDNSPGTPHPFVMCHAHHGRGAVDSAFVMCHAHHGRGAVDSGQAAGVE